MEMMGAALTHKVHNWTFKDTCDETECEDSHAEGFIWHSG